MAGPHPGQFGPSDGQKVRFTEPGTWLGARHAVDPESAAVDVVRRYLAVHGPATRAAAEAEVEDAARFLGGELSLTWL